MKRSIRLIFGICIWSIFIGSAVASTVPQMINYQGRLTDSLGQPLNDTVALTFKLYNVPSGGTALWSEPHGSVVVKDGLFTSLLGSISAIPENTFQNVNTFLGITPELDSEIVPRTQIVSVAYSFNADKLDGYDASDLISLGQPSNTFWCRGTGGGGGSGSFTVCNASGAIREITGISVTMETISSLVTLLIGNSPVIDFNYSPNSTYSYFSWSSANGAGIMIPAGDSVVAAFSNPGQFHVTVTGFEY